jgi:hypothetical protein
VTDFLNEKHKQITDRLRELKPLIEEYRRLEAATAALDGIPASPSGTQATGPSSTRVRRGPGRPRGSKTTTALASTSASPKPTSTGKPTVKRGRRQRKRVGKRAAQALALIRAEPGITIPALGKKMGIKGNYLYTVVPSLEQAGKVRKEGRGWYAKEGRTANRST